MKLNITKIPIFSHNISASESECVVNRPQPCLYCKENFKRPQRCLLAIGSKPVEGSSKKPMYGPPIRVLTTFNFFIFPPLRFSAFRSLN